MSLAIFLLYMCSFIATCNEIILFSIFFVSKNYIVYSTQLEPTMVWLHCFVYIVGKNDILKWLISIKLLPDVLATTVEAMLSRNIFLDNCCFILAFLNHSLTQLPLLLLLDYNSEVWQLLVIYNHCVLNFQK